MYLLLEVLDASYKVYDTVQKYEIEVPKTYKLISGVVNDYISVPYSAYEVKLAQVIEFESITVYATDVHSDYSTVFDKTSLMCLQLSYYSTIQYISIFGYILNNVQTVNVSNDILMFNLSNVCINFRILDTEKFKLYTTKFNILGKKIKPKVFGYTYDDNNFTVFEDDKVLLEFKE